MDRFLLPDPTGDVRMDRVTAGFIRVAELLFPDRIRACYLTGSLIDGTAAQVEGDSLNSSDIDIRVVFKGRAEQHELDRFRECRQACEELGRLGLDQLDAVALDEEGLFRRGDVTLRAASLLVYGEDIRASIPLPRLSDHIDRAIKLSLDLLGTLREAPASALTFPLTYPDGRGEFYGYDYREEAYGGKPGTRILVDAVSWIATALVAIRAGRYAGTKRDAVRLYRECVGDEWTEVVEGIYECCKLRWGYGIPQDEDERRLLRGLCQRVLGLENHFLETCGRRLAGADHESGR
jgi:hypothetical protein